MDAQEELRLTRQLLERAKMEQLVVGGVPDNLPVDLLIPPGATLLGSLVRGPINSRMPPEQIRQLLTIQVFIDAQGDVETLEAAYRQWVQNAGWTIGRMTLPGLMLPPGVIDPPVPGRFEAYLEDGNRLQVLITKQEPAGCSVFMEFSHRPSVPTQWLQRQMSLRRMTDGPGGLGELVQFESSKDSHSETAQYGVIAGNGDAAEAEPALRERLLNAGWVERDRVAVPGEIRSTWMLPALPHDQGELLVQSGPGPSRCTVQLRLFAEPEADGQSQLVTVATRATRARAVAVDAYIGSGQSVPNLPDVTHVKCPQCGQTPLMAPAWTCICGSRWNTFFTRGRCPSCGRHWLETACPSCSISSLHEDWYADREASQ